MKFVFLGLASLEAVARRCSVKNVFLKISQVLGKKLKLLCQCAPLKNEMSGNY